MKQLKRRQVLKLAAGGTGMAIAGSPANYFNALRAAAGPALFTIDRAWEYAIYTGAGIDQITEFAASELAKYINKISGIALSVNRVPALEKQCAVIIAPAIGGITNWEEMTRGTDDLADDGFMVRSGNRYVAMAGANPRGSLYAVYAFLEALGCRFYGLGEKGEIIPSLAPIPVPSLAFTHQPTFRWRDWSEDSRYAKRGNNPDFEKRHEKFWLELTDWFGKNRINMTGNEDYPSLRAEFAKRGVEHWHGGHIIPSFMPRDLFNEHPDYFRMDETGKRVANGNFCPSNPNALKVVAENAIKHIRETPVTRNLEVWGEDVWEGSWCYCEECKQLTVQDQYLIACNAIARAVKEAGLKIDVDAIAYHDTIEPDITIKPEPNLRLMWAPQQQSYGHATNDPSSERNQWYTDCFEEWVSIFGAKNLDLFEYYIDNAVFNTFPVATQHVIAREMQYYTDIGLDNHILLCHLGDCAFQTQPLSCYAYVRMIDDSKQDIDEIIEEYCANMYGAAGGTMFRWHNEFEDAMRYCATFGYIREAPSEWGPRSKKLRSELKKTLKRLTETNLLVKRAKSETTGALEQARIATQEWVNEFAILLVNGKIRQLEAEVYLARVMSSVWSARGSNRDPYAGLAVRFTYVRDEYKAAVEHYENALKLIQSLPPEEQNVWCETTFVSQINGMCRVFRAKIAECELHL